MNVIRRKCAICKLEIVSCIIFMLHYVSFEFLSADASASEIMLYNLLPKYNDNMFYCILSLILCIGAIRGHLKKEGSLNDAVYIIMITSNSFSIVIALSKAKIILGLLHKYIGVEMLYRWKFNCFVYTYIIMVVFIAFVTVIVAFLLYEGIREKKCL